MRSFFRPQDRQEPAVMKPTPPIEAAIDSPMVGLCPSDAASASAQVQGRGLAALLDGPALAQRAVKRRAEAPADADRIEWGPSVGNGAPEVPPGSSTLMGAALKWWRRG